MNTIMQTISAMQTEAFKFKPDRRFYKKIKIKQRRFGQLLRNEKEPTIDEMERIAAYLGVAPNKLWEQRIAKN